MPGLLGVFGKSPFEPLVDHARKVHQCVALVRPIADAFLAGDLERVNDLQFQMSKTEYEADQLKDQIRAALPPRTYAILSRSSPRRAAGNIHRPLPYRLLTCGR
jgi:hypothetical protein